jgi:hypothetical protein
MKPLTVESETRRSLTLTFPMPLNVANARLHWRAKARKHDAWKMLAIVQEPKLRGRPECFGRVRVSVTFFTGRWVQDTDNLIARAKWPLDLLKERGFIADDCPGVVESLSVTQVPRMPRRVVLTLEEVA